MCVCVCVRMHGWIRQIVWQSDFVQYAPVPTYPIHSAAVACVASIPTCACDFDACLGSSACAHSTRDSQTSSSLLRC